MAAKKTTPKKSGTGSANAAEKRMMDKKAKNRTDAKGRSGMGSTKPKSKHGSMGAFMTDDVVRGIATGKTSVKGKKLTPAGRAFGIIGLPAAIGADAARVVGRGIAAVPGALKPTKKTNTKKK